MTSDQQKICPPIYTLIYNYFLSLGQAGRADDFAENNSQVFVKIIIQESANVCDEEEYFAHIETNRY